MSRQIFRAGGRQLPVTTWHAHTYMTARESRSISPRAVCAGRVLSCRRHGASCRVNPSQCVSGALAGDNSVSRPYGGVAPKLANIEIGEISLVPKLSDIWCRNSRTKPVAGFVSLGAQPQGGTACLTGVMSVPVRGEWPDPGVGG